MIIKDMKKLRKETIIRKRASREEKDRIFTRILVWGVYGNDVSTRDDHPFGFYNELKKQSEADGKMLVGKPVARWFPTAWRDGQDEFPIVTRAAWVLLAEVKLPKKRATS